MTGIPGFGEFSNPKILFDFKKDSYLSNNFSNNGEFLCSVIIPTRSLSEDLLDLVDIVLKERILISEILIIIDGPEILDEKIPDKLKVNPLRIFCTGKRRGASASRNVGIENASGDILLFLDDDCKPYQNIINNHLSHYNDKGVIAVGGIVDFVENNSTLSKLIKKSCLLDSFYQAQNEKYLWWNPTANFSVKKDAINNIKFDEKFPKNGGGEDVFFGFQIGKYGKIISEPKAIVKHKIWNGWFNIIRRFFRWGWAESIITNKTLKYPNDFSSFIVRRELTLCTFLIYSFVLTIPLTYLLSNHFLFTIPLGIFLGWQLAAIFSPVAKGTFLERVSDQFFCFIFDCGSTFGRLIPNRFNALKYRVLFNQNQLRALWQNTQLCEKAAIGGGYIAFLFTLILTKHI